MRVVAGLLLLVGCNPGVQRLAIPEEYRDLSISFRVAGADARDLWAEPVCDYGENGTQRLAFLRHTSGWDTVFVEAPCTWTNGLASLERGTVIYHDNARLLTVTADGEFVDHSLDASWVAGRQITKVVALDGAASVLVSDPNPTQGGQAITRLLDWDGSGFVEAPLPSAPLSWSMMAGTPDDLWLLAPWVNNGVDPFVPATTWRREGDTWTSYPFSSEEYGYNQPWSPSSPPDDLWMVHVGDPSSGVVFDHFDGTEWTVETLPDPFSTELRTQGFGPYLGSAHHDRSGNLRLRLSAVFVEGSGSRTNELVYTWDGEAWSEPQQISTYVLLACSSGPCGVRFYGELADGTVVTTDQPFSIGNATAKPHVVLWKP